MILVLDTETSNFRGRIMQLAYSRYNSWSDELLSDTNEYLRHDDPYEVHEDAFAVHGLTYEKCQQNGIDARGSLRDAAHFLNEAQIIVGHKLAFDLGRIKADCDLYGIKWDFTMTDPRMVCTMAKSKEFCHLKDIKGRPKFPNLSELHYRLFGESMEGAHDALNDVRATARCYFELKKRGIV